MINAISKSTNVAPYLKASSQVVTSSLKPAGKVAVLPPKIVSIAPKERITSYSLYTDLPRGNISVVSGPAVSTQVRYAHTDITVPDFTEYRRDSTKPKTAQYRSSIDDRMSFSYFLAGTAAVASAYTAKTIVHEFVSSMSASADVLALAKIEVKLSDIPEGKNATFKWRGKPLFIRHRTSDEIAQEKSVTVSQLRDPQHDDDRVKRPEWLVIIGVCTHLGCVPIANSGDFGGYYCPCHGSHYDASGRIRKGPAPLNLEVPQYIFPDEDTLLVG